MVCWRDEAHLEHKRFVLGCRNHRDCQYERYDNQYDMMDALLEHV
jgi:hypothetical protein